MSLLAIRWWFRRLGMRMDGKWPLDRKWTAWKWDDAVEASKRENANIKTYRSRDEWPRP